jgi:hypothetical protein
VPDTYSERKLSPSDGTWTAAVHALTLLEDRHAGAIQSLRYLVTKPEKNVPLYHRSDREHVA